MAEYKGIKGFKVQTVSTDPVASAIAGGTWASGGDLNTGRGLMGNGMGTQTAAAVVAGLSPPSTYFANTELYNGTSWTESGDLPSTRYQGMAGGTQTAGIYAGGYGGSFPAFADTYYFNGTTWSEQNDLNTARGGMAQSGQGSQTSAIVAGGTAPPAPAPPGSTTVETWDGTSWAAGTALPTANKGFAGAGVLNSFLTFGGAPYPSVGNTTNLWNGSTWTSQPTLNTARGAGTSGFGSNISAVVAGNGPTTITTVESYNGSSWTSAPSLNTGRSNAAAAGSSNTDGVVFSGSSTSATEEYNGTSWTTSPVTNGPIYQQSPAAAGGPSTSALIAGGNNPATNATYIWSGGQATTQTVTVS